MISIFIFRSKNLLTKF